MSRPSQGNSTVRKVKKAHSKQTGEKLDKSILLIKQYC